MQAAQESAVTVAASSAAFTIHKMSEEVQQVEEASAEKVSRLECVLSSLTRRNDEILSEATERKIACKVLGHESDEQRMVDARRVRTLEAEAEQLRTGRVADAARL